MSLSPLDTYLETQVSTATPQRLRLMLVEGALRHAREAQACWKEGRSVDGMQSASRCREILSELIAGIHPDQTAVARQVLEVYVFLFSQMIELQFTRDGHQLTSIIRVLEEEQQTWQEVCRRLPDRVVADAACTPAEEIAPQIVAGRLDGRHLGTIGGRSEASAGLSIDA
jgi:flagellar protein FliS